MKKQVLFVAFMLLLGGCSISKSNQSTKAGGVSITKIDERGELALKFALSDTKIKNDPYKLLEYKKQVVNGINHFFYISTENASYNIKVYETLNGDYTLKNIEKHVKDTKKN